MMLPVRSRWVNLPILVMMTFDEIWLNVHDLKTFFFPMAFQYLGSCTKIQQGVGEGACLCS